MLDIKKLSKIEREKDKGKVFLEKQTPPITLKIELTKGCNLQCSFCAIKTIQKKPGSFKFLKIKIVKKLIIELKRLNWSPRIECAMRGEPLANPNYLQIFRTLNKNLQNSPIIVSTNGAYLLRGNVTHNIDNLMKYITALCIEDYSHTNFVQKIIENYKGDYEFELFKNKSTYSSSSRKRIIIFPDISKSVKGKLKSNTRRLHNMGGNIKPLDFSKIKVVCTRPFREYNVFYNGDVPLCCVDWKGKYIIGNIMKTKMEEIWESPLYNATRKILYFYGRVFGPCYGCNMPISFASLLPDRNGKTTMSPITNNDIELVRNMSKKFTNRFSKTITQI